MNFYRNVETYKYRDSNHTTTGPFESSKFWYYLWAYISITIHRGQRWFEGDGTSSWTKPMGDSMTEAKGGTHFLRESLSVFTHETNPVNSNETKNMLV